MNRIFLLPFLFCLAVFANALETSERPYQSISEVPIHENGDLLIDLKDQSVIAYGERFILDNPGCTIIRKTVYDKLCQAQALLPSGLRFEVNIGLRTLAIQAKLFQERYEQLKEKFPSKSDAEIFDETCNFVAPVITLEGKKNTPPHSTGGAIDIVLMTEGGDPVDMGDDPNDSFNPAVIQTNSTLISAEARANREILGKALSSVGFVNYPAEFWHWSYGDRRWAFVTNAPCAVYGAVDAAKE